MPHARASGSARRIRWILDIEQVQRSAPCVPQAKLLQAQDAGAGAVLVALRFLPRRSIELVNRDPCRRWHGRRRQQRGDGAIVEMLRGQRIETRKRAGNLQGRKLLHRARLRDRPQDWFPVDTKTAAPWPQPAAAVAGAPALLLPGARGVVGAVRGMPVRC